MLHQWMSEGENSNIHHRVMDYFADLKVARRSSVFWVSRNTLSYYTQAGFFKAVSANEPRDNWFFDFLSSNERQALALDVSEVV